jgi:ketosteroid isomerase-like protein
MSEHEEVLRANNLFYEALGTRDLRLMGEVWVQDQRAKCVHPGWTMLEGWEAIRQSWESVFDPSDRVLIELSNVSCEVKGDVAWVTCIQRLTYVNRIPMGVSISISTNIFERKGGRWLMVLHHASPIPRVAYEHTGEPLQ